MEITKIYHQGSDAVHLTFEQTFGTHHTFEQTFGMHHTFEHRDGMWRD